ncbi:GNAT family N-acetyltransferase [Variovorax sp. Root434]|uniref:GNAT family N-acetyltransferase n=1 Tax=Variovorax sp. Root434 TaxID=1736536 RepID=UPI0006F4D092|nr:GNAT family N-acetyltransferase [Variovorax sp. Root434]KQX22142.1 hypothetical protein ASD05_14415 [Variovorax sp. Root434]
MLTDVNANEIAALLNSRNQLIVKYSAAKVLAAAEEYVYRMSDAEKVIACVQVKKVQWYQAEVLHLTVDESAARKGHAKGLLRSAEDMAIKQGARLLQCTIRDGNKESEGLFLGAGFTKVSAFHNVHSGNTVGVFQKVLVSPPKEPA